MLGLNYLEEIKRQRKQTTNSQLHFSRKDLQSEENNRATKKALTNYPNYLDSHRNRQDYNELRQKRIDKLIHSETADKFERIHMLQMEANKLVEEQKRQEEKIKLMKGKDSSRNEDESESIGLLMASIKAKMGIIDVYNKD